MTSKKTNLQKKPDMQSIDEAATTRDLVEKHSSDILKELDWFDEFDKLHESITLDGFLSRIIKYLLISLSDLLSKEQYKDLVNMFKHKMLTNISAEDRLKWHVYIKRGANLPLKLEDYKSLVARIFVLLHIDPTESDENRAYHTYFLQLLNNFSHLLEELNVEELGFNDTSAWKYAYKIGLLQGKLGLTKSIVDPELIDKHHVEKSGEGSKRFWDNRRKLQEQEEKPIIEEINRIAEDRWGEKNETALHNEMAEYICGQLLKTCPELAAKPNLNKLVFRTLRPIARKYNRLRGVPIPELLGTIEKVNISADSIIVKSNEGKKPFLVLVKKTTTITKRNKHVSLTHLKKGMNVLIKYRMENKKMIATTIKINTYFRPILKK